KIRDTIRNVWFHINKFGRNYNKQQAKLTTSALPAAHVIGTARKVPYQSKIIDVIITYD
ncbi:hypothetical protein ACJX0J_006844, partial [Zea mays]